MLNFRIVFLSSIALAFIACSPTPVPDAGTPDAGVTDMGVAADVSRTDVQDVQVDTGPVHVPQLFGDCQSDDDCVTGDMCLLNTTGFPGGFCTHRATCHTGDDCNTDANPPGVIGLCRLVGAQMLCQRQCLNGFDCGRDGYTCIKASSTATSGYCAPSCDVNNCGTGAVCNLWTSQCQAPPLPTTGTDDGLACTMSGTMSECRSHICILSNNMGTFSGWNNGSCRSNCALGPGWSPGSLWSTEVFPQGNCPAGNICFPTSYLAEHDPGICLHECRADSDCRVSEGYRCQKTFNRGRTPHTWMNGYCAPMDCLAAGMTCPSGYMCETQYHVSGATRTPFGVCRPEIPDAGTPDAGTPDAGPPDAGTPDVGTPDDGLADTGVTLPDVALSDAGLDVSVD